MSFKAVPVVSQLVYDEF